MDFAKGFREPRQIQVGAISGAQDGDVACPLRFRRQRHHLLSVLVVPLPAVRHPKVDAAQVPMGPRLAALARAVVSVRQMAIEAGQRTGHEPYAGAITEIADAAHLGRAVAAGDLTATCMAI